MNTISLFLYITDVLGAIDGFFLFLAIISTIVAIVYGLMLTSGCDEMQEWLEKLPRALKLLWIPLFFSFATILIPTTNTMYMMAASQSIESLSKMEQVQALGGEAGALATDAIKLLRGKISEAIEEATPTKKSSE
jgi:hypothetical protein